MTKNFIVLYQAGSFFSETVEKEVDSWDIEIGKKLSDEYNAYGFQFKTMSNDEDGWAQKIIDRSGTYYVNGKVYSYEELAESGIGGSTLLRNMKYNDWSKAVNHRHNGWQPFKDEDRVV